ncbi:SRPBCC domain-containing protein [Kocuria himachalensis]
MRKHDRGLLLTLSSTLVAPRDRVFRALTDPGDLARWWGPHGFTMPGAELDLRVGGGYRLSMQPPEGDLFHLSGEFLEIDPPARLAYTFRWEEPTADDQETIVRLSLDARGRATEVSPTQGPFATAERLELHRRGWTDSFDRLRGHLGPGS